MTRQAALDRLKIVNAAVELLNSEGSEVLSLTRLAEHLGVRTPSLYNHIDGLPGLQHELALFNMRSLGARLENAAIAKSGSQALRAVAQAYRAYIKENPGLYLTSLRAARTETPADPELQSAEDRVVEIGLAVVASFGLEGEEALHAVRGLRSVIHGFATLEVAGGFGLPLACDESYRRLVDLLIRGLEASTG